MKGYMSAREASCKWGISESQVHKLCQQGRIPGLERFGRSWAITEDTLPRKILGCATSKLLFDAQFDQIFAT